MNDFVLNLADIHIGGGNLRVDLQDAGGVKVNMTGATAALQCVVSCPGNTLSIGDVVIPENTIGMTQLNNNEYTVVGRTTSAVTLNVDSRGFTPYSSGGTLRKSTFAYLGATDKSAGATLIVGEKQLKDVFGENDLDEPKAQIFMKQDITFETVLSELSLRNIALAIGDNSGEFPSVGAANPYTYIQGYISGLPKSHAFVYEVPQEANPEKKIFIVMPRAQIVGVAEIKFTDEDVTSLKLVLRLRKVIDPNSPLHGRKFEIRREV